MDNASTSDPKPPAVMDAMTDFAANCGASAGRGAYQESRWCGQMITQCRQRIAQLINAEAPERIIFTMNCSEALSMAIHGLLNDATDAHVIVTAMEHNSVLRPLNTLKFAGKVQLEVIPCDGTGMVNPDDVRKAIKPGTELIVCTMASNVSGAIQPNPEVVKIARENGIHCLIDGAQGGGHLSIDVQALGVDLLALPGHKGLMGPLGTGILYIRPGMEERLPTVKEGGTGSRSELMVQPEIMPDRYEIGSHNAIGLAGLSAAVAWLLDAGVDSIRQHDIKLNRLFLSLTEHIDHLSVYGPRNVDQCVGLFSVNVAGMPPGDLAGALEAGAGVLTRPGLHCAPLAHKTIGTYPNGTCRLSFGAFTTEDDVRRAVAELVRIAESQGNSAASKPAA